MTMISTPSQLLELQRLQVNAMNTVGQALLAGAERLSNLNAATSRGAIDAATQAAQSLAGVRYPDDLSAISGASAQPSLDKLMGYARQWTEIVNGVNVEIGKVVEQQVNDGNRRMTELFDYAAKNAPAGSEHAVALMRSAIAASNTAFGAISKAFAVR